MAPYALAMRHRPAARAPAPVAHRWRRRDHRYVAVLRWTFVVVVGAATVGLIAMIIAEAALRA